MTKFRPAGLTTRSFGWLAVTFLPLMAWGCGDDDLASSGHYGQGPNGPGDQFHGGGGNGGGGAGDQLNGTSHNQPQGTGVPCDVAQVLETHCASCHGEALLGGAPMPLLVHEDFTAPSYSAPERPYSALVQERIHDPVNPMPPANVAPMGEAERAILDAWLSAGSPAGTLGDSCVVGGSNADDGSGNDDPPDFLNDWPEAECHQLLNHGGDMSSPYSVRTGEHYSEFYFDPPWNEPSVLVGFRTVADKRELLHHWLLYKTNSTRPDGYVATETIGSHIGESVELLAGWAVGGNDMDIPPGIAVALPPPSGKLMIEWHYYNTTGQQQTDRSGIEICVVPESAADPSKVASMTWVGNEDLGAPSLLGVTGFFGMPAGQETRIVDTCTPSFNNVPQGEPITIFSFTPHMHEIGTHMRTWVARANGTVELVFDRPFQFDHQLSYILDEEVKLYRGDRLVNECTFFNNTNAAVGFGPSSDQEMCYQFTYAYPAGSLENGVSSLTGASNTCWDNNQAEAQQLINQAGG